MSGAAGGRPPPTPRSHRPRQHRARRGGARGGGRRRADHDDVGGGATRRRDARALLPRLQSRRAPRARRHVGAPAHRGTGSPRVGRMAARVRARPPRPCAARSRSRQHHADHRPRPRRRAPRRGRARATRRRRLLAQGGAARLRRHRLHHHRLRAPRLLHQSRSGERQHAALALPRRVARLHPRRGTAHVATRRPFLGGARQRRDRAATPGSSATSMCWSAGLRASLEGRITLPGVV